MAAAASARLATTATRHGAAAAALYALLDYVPDGASRAAAQLLLRELTAALGIELQRQAHQGGGAAGGPARTRRRREQRRAALARLRASSATHDGGIVAGSARGRSGRMAGEGVGGQWFQVSTVAGATATRSDGREIDERMESRREPRASRPGP